MYEYKCIQCNYQTNNKSNYTKHLNSKKHEKNVLNKSTDTISFHKYQHEIERLNKELEEKDKRIMELENIIATTEISPIYNITIDSLVQVCNPGENNMSNLVNLIEDAIKYQQNGFLNQ